MANKKQQIKQPFTTQLERIAKYAVDKYDAKEVLVALLDAINTHTDRLKCADAIVECVNIQDEVIDKVREKDKQDGWLCVKIEGLFNQYKVKEFIENEIYTYYNEQQTIFA